MTHAAFGNAPRKLWLRLCSGRSLYSCAFFCNPLYSLCCNRSLHPSEFLWQQLGSNRNVHIHCIPLHYCAANIQCILNFLCAAGQRPQRVHH